MKGFLLINVLDKGYIKLVNNMGTDLDIVNSARVSFDKEVSELSQKDNNLILFLVKERHDACFRHCVMTFEIYAPLMVARQWYKHSVASTHLDDQMGWNESSRRYITEKEEFYIPDANQWRCAPENKKQGSGDFIKPEIGSKYLQRMRASVNRGLEDYRQALEDGIAPEQARLLLPAYAMYVRWRWTVSLNGVMNFLNLRLDPHAQWEIQQYAKIIEEYVEQFYPITYDAWIKYRMI
jgi:thymidylate synthase (FAD)